MRFGKCGLENVAFRSRARHLALPTPPYPHPLSPQVPLFNNTEQSWAGPGKGPEWGGDRDRRSSDKYVNLERGTAMERYKHPYTPIQEAPLDGQWGRHCQDLGGAFPEYLKGMPWTVEWPPTGRSTYRAPWVPDNGIGSGPLPGARSSGVPATDCNARVRAGLLGLGWEASCRQSLYTASPLKQGKAISLINNISSPLSHTRQCTLSGPTRVLYRRFKGYPTTYKVNVYVTWNWYYNVSIKYRGWNYNIRRSLATRKKYSLKDQSNFTFDKSQVRMTNMWDCLHDVHESYEVIRMQGDRGPSRGARACEC